MSLCRQNYSPACEAGLSKQINQELRAFYEYYSMASYFGRDDVALPGFQKFFKEAAEEEMDHVNQMVNYQAERGGRMVFEAIPKPEEWHSALHCLEHALEVEKQMNAGLLKLHKIAEENNDTQFMDFLESKFLNEQIEANKTLADLIANLKRVGADNLGLYLFDKKLKADMH
eukprot:comp22366_c1_seq1/m.33331 comp22366_c1_seq1/g.33331  ORF comp22366_c1_seq1/g.33331 comp22366_c1_seq1/m.33331 type:complete len:172 (-) comp22366_c1_seq1:646-1161(-)